MFATVGFFSLLTVSGRAPTPQPAALYYRPRIEVWTNRGDDPYASGQAARVSFRTEQDAYVTLFRVDTDGRVRVLYPREPWDDNFARVERCSTTTPALATSSPWRPLIPSSTTP